RMRLSAQPILSHSDNLDLAFLLSPQALELLASEMQNCSLKVVDQENSEFYLPMSELAEQAGAKISLNMVVLGGIVGFMQGDLTILNTIIRENFQAKGEKIININLEAARLGYEYVQKQQISDFVCDFSQNDQKTKILVNGNQALALGAVQAGLKLFAAYPMTPSSSIMTELAVLAQDHEFTVHHVEDEIAAINMAIGGSFAGLRTATSTSGGGFALMTEALGMAGMTEIPLVIYLVQRPGPSTGLPTKTAQGDLNLAVYSSQGDFPHLVLAPGSVQSCFSLSKEAFTLAEKYQLPVIVLSDKYLADSEQSLILEDLDLTPPSPPIPFEAQTSADRDFFPRYQDLGQGISPRTWPGIKDGHYIANSYEHQDTGEFAEEETEVVKMMAKREKKMQNLQKEISSPQLFSENADILLLVWGGMTGPTREAQKQLVEEGIKCDLCQIQYLYPLSLQIPEIFQKYRKIIGIEGNESGQLSKLIASEFNLKVDLLIRNYWGRMPSAEWIVDSIKTQLNS
ncbi:MAG TPA: 2-oxoacid:acceptor oxidoreductase subunit alpha, partial [Candidatus Gracilibacteria bacterium]|nr:2-oxoacid:acceptor oxidoreductase subunit alpha [Candidatus Gracilibacteria bacterium]